MAPSFSRPLLDPWTKGGYKKPLTLSLAFFILIRYGPSTLHSVLKHVKDTFGISSKGPASSETLTPANALQQVYISNADGSKTLLVTYQDKVVKVPIHPTPLSKFESDKAHFPPLSSSAKAKPNIDKAFMAQLKALVGRIAIPGLWSTEMGVVCLHSFFLVMRTVLSILVARLDGRIVRDLVRKDGKGFLKGLALWFLLAVPSTFTNSMVRRHLPD